MNARLFIGAHRVRYLRRDDLIKNYFSCKVGTVGTGCSAHMCYDMLAPVHQLSDAATKIAMFA